MMNEFDNDMAELIGLAAQIKGTAIRALSRRHLTQRDLIALRTASRGIENLMQRDCQRDCCQNGTVYLSDGALVGCQVCGGRK